MHIVLSVQPHVPPPVTARHDVPTLLLAHVVHAPPVEPHVATSVPVVHVPAEVQHPPLQALVAEQAVVH
jgi:hypothetical protein